MSDFSGCTKFSEYQLRHKPLLQRPQVWFPAHPGTGSAHPCVTSVPRASTGSALTGMLMWYTHTCTTKHTGAEKGERQAVGSEQPSESRQACLTVTWTHLDKEGGDP